MVPRRRLKRRISRKGMRASPHAALDRKGEQLKKQFDQWGTMVGRAFERVPEGALDERQVDRFWQTFSATKEEWDKVMSSLYSAFK